MNSLVTQWTLVFDGLDGFSQHVDMGSGAVLAEWTQIGESIDYAGYVDLSTIQRAGSFSKMWDLMDYKTPRRVLGLSFLSQ